jgi:antitoxin HicB
MAKLMKARRGQVDRLFDPENGSATLNTLIGAAHIVGREQRLELVWNTFPEMPGEDTD